jgi:hypothetical protein
MEVIWGNRLKAGDNKYIGRFPTSLPTAATIGSAGGSTRRSSAHVYPEIWKDAVLAHVVDVAVFCDSDDTTPPASATSPMSGLNGGDDH